MSAHTRHYLVGLCDRVVIVGPFPTAEQAEEWANAGDNGLPNGLPWHPLIFNIGRPLVSPFHPREATQFVASLGETAE